MSGRLLRISVSVLLIGVIVAGGMTLMAKPGGSKGWWDVWTNQAEMRPYHPNLHHGWSRWWAYDGGGRCYGVTGWGTHSYDQIQRALGTDETGPVEVWLEEPVTVMATGKYATPADVLEDLATEHELPGRILDYRQVQKLKSMFRNALGKSDLCPQRPEV